LRPRAELIIAAVVLAALLVGDAMIHRPKRDALASVQRKAARAEQELLYVVSHRDELSRIQDFLPVPLEGDVQGAERFLALVNEEAGRLGAVITRVEPMGETPDGDYMQRTFKLTLEGEFSEFRGFLRFLEEIPEVVIVHSFDYRSSAISAAATHRAAITLSVIGY
jgi:hypothetical protein